MIDFVVDASPHKQGKFLPGSHIPVVDMEHLLRKEPEVIIIFPWNLKNEISTLLKEKCSFQHEVVVFVPELTKIS
jgi:ABC-type Fe3+-hydroxamate transport system substrate-binding protein